jgi:hypothetical protein
LKRLCLTTVVGLMMATASYAGGFDGERSGFFMEFGLGGGISWYDQSYAFLDSTGIESGHAPRITKGAAAFDFKLGGGIGEQLIIYWGARSSFFDGPVEKDSTVVSVPLTSTTSGIGVRYYTSEQTPSLFYHGTIGFTNWWAPLEDNAARWGGFGMQGGMGYEFSKHWVVESSIAYGNPKSEGSEITVWSVLFTLNVSLY